MQIDNIPLPPLNSIKKFDNNNLNNYNYHKLPLKRAANHRLPVGLLPKQCCGYKAVEASAVRKELFLPTQSDTINSNINYNSVKKTRWSKVDEKRGNLEYSVEYFGENYSRRKIGDNFDGKLENNARKSAEYSDYSDGFYGKIDFCNGKIDNFDKKADRKRKFDNNDRKIDKARKIDNHKKVVNDNKKINNSDRKIDNNDRKIDNYRKFDDDNRKVDNNDRKVDNNDRKIDNNDRKIDYYRKFDDDNKKFDNDRKFDYGNRKIKNDRKIDNKKRKFDNDKKIDSDQRKFDNNRRKINDSRKIDDDKRKINDDRRTIDNDRKIDDRKFDNYSRKINNYRRRDFVIEEERRDYKDLKMNSRSPPPRRRHPEREHWQQRQRERYSPLKSVVVVVKSQVTLINDNNKHNNNKHIVSVVKSFSSSSSSSSPSSSSSSLSVSSSSSSVTAIVSPTTPEDDSRNITNNNITTVNTSANEYLKQLQNSLEKINVAFKSVFPQIPDQKKSPNPSLSNIPLPVVFPSPQHNKILSKNNVDISEYTTIKNDNAYPAIVSHELQPVIKDPVIDNNNNNNKKINNRKLSNSINERNLSCVSNSTAASKGLRSPIFVSNYSKESDNSEILSLMPTIPEITSFHFDYSNIDRSLLGHWSQDFFVNTIRCNCAMPNPDQWNNEAVRACGHGQECVLRRLKIECSSKHCPTEDLCTNCQFQQLDKNKCVELYYDNGDSSWKIRTRAAVYKGSLLFEVSGTATIVNNHQSLSDDSLSSQYDILITKAMKLSLRSDSSSMIYYLSHGTLESANVHIERWLVDGRIRIGVFTLKNIDPQTELVLFYNPNCLNVLEDSTSLDNEDDTFLTLQSFLYEFTTEDKLCSILEKLLSPNSAPNTLESFMSFGGVSLLFSLSIQSLSCNSFKETLLIKLMDLLTMVVSSCYTGKKSEVSLLGLEMTDFLDQIGSIVRFLGSHHNSCFTGLEKLKKTINDALKRKEAIKIHSSDHNNNNLYTLNCRLPTYWCSRECQSNEGESRVFFYHKVTKFVQWEMPVYPWESNEDDEADIYDYDTASTIPVTHDEIHQMYLNLNKMYEIKQKKIIIKENKLRPLKEKNEFAKKETFRKKMTEFISRLLKPYRDVGCREGRITSEEDLRYLANKLSQTILDKELKILNNAAEYLEVSTIVEKKTKIYLQTYMQSRGNTYKRPQHRSEINHTNNTT